MSTPKSRILLQFDTDGQPSSFDAIVALDSGVDHLLPYANVNPGNVVGLTHGAIFTRGPADLANTAIFIGGSDVARGEQLYQTVCNAFFGPLQVSVMLDCNGANTTASAAVLNCNKHLPLQGKRVLVLAGTGAVGQRVCQLAAHLGAEVGCHSRSREKLEVMKERLPGLHLCHRDSTSLWNEWLTSTDAVIACGAAGIPLLSTPEIASMKKCKVLIDLNAVPPLGLANVQSQDKGQERDGVVCYGALGVGSLKMKIHRSAIQKLFESNRCRLDSIEILELGRALVS